MLHSVECGRCCRGSGLPAQHILAGLKAPEEREQRGCWGSGRAWRFGWPMRSITHGLSSVPAATYVFVESSDWSSSPSAIVAVANQPKICCAHHSAIGIAAFPIGRVQHASSHVSLPLWNHTQHSSERTIGRQSDSTAGRRPDDESSRARSTPGTRFSPKGRFAKTACESGSVPMRRRCNAGAYRCLSRRSVAGGCDRQPERRPASSRSFGVAEALVETSVIRLLKALR